MQCEILQNQSIARGIYRMRLAAPGLYCQPGQFVHLSTPPTSQGTLLRRPISIHDYDAEAGILTLCYALVGRGTRALSELSAGQTLDVLGPLGNGFCLPDAGRVLLIGGGLVLGRFVLKGLAAVALILMGSFVLSILGTALAALVTVLLKRGSVAGMWRGVCAFWVFALSQMVLTLLSFVHKETSWKPIAHTSAKNLQDFE